MQIRCDGVTSKHPSIFNNDKTNIFLRIEDAGDLDDIVSKQRIGWRAGAAKAPRKQRRDKKMLTAELFNGAKDDNGELS